MAEMLRSPLPNELFRNCSELFLESHLSVCPPRGFAGAQECLISSWRGVPQGSLQGQAPRALLLGGTSVLHWAAVSHWVLLLLLPLLLLFSVLHGVVQSARQGRSRGSASRWAHTFLSAGLGFHRDASSVAMFYPFSQFLYIYIHMNI